ncbi:hypothetical protein [Guptibacillus hwajinpoensis]|uniref:Uncharacterized protein n=1 Tax=Guptibacillus hwajinpoensis TaxID=208199 RepID=A0A0J6FXJ3_9BACL|nr:hypothetical protein [Alkalihalobacillus macyae]KMM39082.1 hypothetical protein AB986_07575 [Alkalihalobacillus macyae]
MVTKNGSKLSKTYFKSYMQLVMSSREFSLDEARAYAFAEIFQNDETTNGPASFEQFELAYEEMVAEQDLSN